MTITVGTLKAGPFTPTGVEQVLPFPFMVFDDTLVEVYQLLDGVKTVLLEGSYTVDRNVAPNGQPQEGGDITITANPDLGDLYVRGTPSKGQGQQWSNSGSRLDGLNPALDRLTQRDLELEDQQDELAAAVAIDIAGKLDKPDGSSGFVALSGGEVVLLDDQIVVGVEVTSFSTRALAALANVDPAMGFLRVAGFTAVGVGPGLYRRVMSDPGDMGGFQTLDGAWWDYVPEAGVLDLDAWGARSAADVGTILNAAAARWGGKAILKFNGVSYTQTTPFAWLASGYGSQPDGKPWVPAPKIRGNNQMGTTINTPGIIGPAWDFDTPANATPGTGAVFAFGLEVTDIQFRGDGVTDGSDAIQYRAMLSPQFKRVSIRKYGRDGVRIIVNLGDNDASNMPKFDACRIEDGGNIGDGGFALRIGGSAHNEISYTHIGGLSIQRWGACEEKAIGSISYAGNQVTITQNAHGYANGDKIFVFLCEGSLVLNERMYTVSDAAANTYKLKEGPDVSLAYVDSTGYAAYTGQGATTRAQPRSGAIYTKGQIFNVGQGVAVTLCWNVVLYVVGGSPGTTNGFCFNNYTDENNQGIGILIEGALGFKIGDSCQMYVSGGNFVWQGQQKHKFATGILQAWNFAIQNFTLYPMQVRATNHPGEAKMVHWIGMGPNLVQHTFEIYPQIWQAYDYNLQKRFVGLQGRPVIDQCEVLNEGGNVLRLRGNGHGNICDMKLRGPAGGSNPSTTGEYAPIQLPAGGVAVLMTGLPANQTLQVYSYDAFATLGRPQIECATTAYVRDPGSGRDVKADDYTKRWRGTVRTDGSGNILNPTPGWVLAPLIGGAYLWTDSTGDLRVKPNTPPASDTDGTVVGTQT